MEFPEGEHFDCGSCAKCCRTEWNVHVSPPAYDLVRVSSLFKKVHERCGTLPMVETEIDGQPAILAHVTERGCVFLEDKLCSIHRELGEATKPLGCRQFPFFPLVTPDGVVVGLSYYCSAVQKGEGRPVAAHREAVAGMFREYRFPRLGFDPIAWGPGVTVSWAAYKALERVAHDLLQGDGVASGRGPFELMTTCARVQVLLEDASRGAGGIVADDTFMAALAGAARMRVGRDEVFVMLDDFVTAALVALIEVSRPADRAEATRAILEGRALAFPGRGPQDIDLAAFTAWRSALGDVRAAQEDMDRYVRHLVFRKLLARDRTVISNAAALYQATRLVAFYRDLEAYVRGAPAPEAADLHQALDIIERDLLLHARGLDVLLAEMARGYVEQVRALG